MRSRLVQVGDVRLHVGVHPGSVDGPPVLLMHGGMAHAAWWSPLMHELASTFRLFALDRRGHGRSDWTDVGNYGWTRDLEDAEHVGAALHAGPWIVVGHSQGGLLSVHLALRGRLPMRALVVLDSPLDPRAPSLRSAGASFRRMPQVRYPSLASAARRFQPYPSPHHVPEEVLRRIAHESFKPSGDGGVVSRFHWKRFQADDGPPHPLECFRDDLARVPVPTLVVRAEESTILSAADHATFVRRLPHGQGAVVPGTTHSLHVERPAAVATEIRSFLSRL